MKEQKPQREEMFVEGSTSAWGALGVEGSNSRECFVILSKEDRLLL